MKITELDAKLRAARFRFVRALRKGIIVIIDERLALFFYPDAGTGIWEYDGLEVGDYQGEWLEDDRKLDLPEILRRGARKPGNP